jgi:hypothetical protein
MSGNPARLRRISIITYENNTHIDMPDFSEQARIDYLFLRQSGAGCLLGAGCRPACLARRVEHGFSEDIAADWLAVSIGSRLHRGNGVWHANGQGEPSARYPGPSP